MIERHKQIQKGDINHTSESASTKYTVFDTGSYVLLEPATGGKKIGYTPVSWVHSWSSTMTKILTTFET